MHRRSPGGTWSTCLEPRLSWSPPVANAPTLIRAWSRTSCIFTGAAASTYYQHAVEIEVYLDEGDAEARDAAFDALLQQIGAVLETDPTLGGLAFGLTYGRSEPAIEAVAGAPAIKSTTLPVTIDYETDTPLS